MADEMKTDLMGKYFVAHITITEVKDLKHGPVYRNSNTSETREQKTNEIAKIIVKDGDLLKLLQRATKHLELIEEYEE